MKYITLTTLFFGFLLFGCNQVDKKTISQVETNNSTSTDDKEKIQNLIRQVLNWANSKKSFDLLPVVSDSKDSLYIGFDLRQHKQNLINLNRQTCLRQNFSKTTTK